MDLSLLNGYSENVINQVRELIEKKKLGTYLKTKYPNLHSIKSDKELYNYATKIKRQYMRNSDPINKVVYDKSILSLNSALGLHTYTSKQHGRKTVRKNDVKISNIFRECPEEFLHHIIVHELAHIKVKDHSKKFYQLCCLMEENYPEVELDLRLYLIYKKY